LCQSTAASVNLHATVLKGTLKSLVPTARTMAKVRRKFPDS
jgi:hypothetical protein